MVAGAELEGIQREALVVVALVTTRLSNRPRLLRQAQGEWGGAGGRGAEAEEPAGSG